MCEQGLNIIEFFAINMHFKIVFIFAAPKGNLRGDLLILVLIWSYLVMCITCDLDNVLSHQNIKENPVLLHS